MFKYGPISSANSAAYPVAEASRTIAKKVSAWIGMVSLAVATVAQPALVQTASAQNALKNYIEITAENAAIPKMIRLGLDKSMVVDLPADAHDILVANPDVADAITRTSRRIYLFGKEVGQTNVFVFDGKGKQIAAMEIIIERDITGLEDTLARLIKNSEIRVEMISDNVVLTGRVATPADATKAVALAQVFVEGGEATAGNNGNTGLAALFGGTPESQIVNLLKIDGEDQVMLKVTIAEVQRSVVKQLGISTSVTNSTNDGFGFAVEAAGVAQQGVTSVGGNFGLIHGLNSIRGQLQALESTGVMRTLAEPSLTAVSGETAHFRVGGQYNVVGSASETPDAATGTRGLSVTFNQQDYGIALSFTPTVLTEGRISLSLRTEVQEPTSTGAQTFLIQANSPGTRNRQASTTVELPSGGSMVIAGLVQDDVRQTVSGFPGLKSIPVLGTLFRSREFVRNESEVMIIVTPYLVRPTARKNLARADENFQPASDAAGMFMGRVNRVFGTKQGNLPKGRYTGSIGFILK